jgi:hypothetical protein
MKRYIGATIDEELIKHIRRNSQKNFSRGLEAMLSDGIKFRELQNNTGCPRCLMLKEAFDKIYNEFTQDIILSQPAPPLPPPPPMRVIIEGKKVGREGIL